MGTNYYVEGDKCQACGRVPPIRHIGKSSAGWVFSLRIYPEEGIYGLPDWVDILAKSPKIQDEYGREVSPSEMLGLIMLRSRDKPPVDFDWQLNKAEPGPRNLIRVRRGERGISHGDGSWDCHTGDFS